ncbi:hypothetical protein HYW42_00325 [Candidatus Daviesbacteria bacterium]|nr:hypothetical protein [Candidatus Daviesbacteria bacterium]
MRKTLVTHINPHLDDITAIWLFKKFHPDFQDTDIEFISASREAALKEESAERIFVGTGGGKFDEHKGDLEDSATSLVWKYLKEQNLVPTEDSSVKALEELVEWVRLDDLGRLKNLPYPQFYVPGFIRVYGPQQQADSLENTTLGFQILDRVYQVLINKQKAEKDWENKIEFETKWGKGVAVESENVSRAFCDTKNGEVFLMYDPKFKSVQFYTPREDVDLEPIYQTVKELDPQASWFLHQSHKMVICGSGSAPASKPTKLIFEQLIDIAKSS